MYLKEKLTNAGNIIGVCVFATIGGLGFMFFSKWSIGLLVTRDVGGASIAGAIAIFTLTVTVKKVIGAVKNLFTNNVKQTAPVPQPAPTSMAHPIQSMTQQSDIVDVYRPARIEQSLASNDVSIACVVQPPIRKSSERDDFKAGYAAGKEIARLISLAREERAGELYSVLKGYIESNSISLTNLNTEIKQGLDKNKTLLWLLIDTAIKGNYPRELNQVFQALQLTGNISQYNLNIESTEDAIQWQIVLLTLINLAYQNKSYQRYLDNIIGDLLEKRASVNVLNTVAAYGPNQGKTFFWMLLDLALQGCQETLNCAIKLLIEAKQIASINLSAAPNEGPDKDKSVLRMLIDLAKQGTEPPLTRVIEAIGDTLDFHSVISKGSGADKTLLCEFIDLARMGIFDPLRCTIKSIGKTADFNAIITTGPNKGKTLLSILLALDRQILATVLIDAIDAFIERGEISEILNVVQPNDKTLLWLLIDLARNGYIEPLQRAIQAVKTLGKMDILDFNVAPKDGPEQGQTAFWVLLDAVKRHSNCKEIFNSIVGNLTVDKIANIDLDAAPTSIIKSKKTVLWMLSSIIYLGELLNDDCLKCIVRIVNTLTKDRIANLDLDVVINEEKYEQNTSFSKPSILKTAFLRPFRMNDRKIDMGTAIAIALAHTEEIAILRAFLRVVIKRKVNIKILYDEFVKIAKNNDNKVKPLITLYQLMDNEDVNALTDKVGRLEAKVCKRAYSKISEEIIALARNYYRDRKYNEEMRKIVNYNSGEIFLPCISLQDGTDSVYSIENIIKLQYSNARKCCFKSPNSVKMICLADAIVEDNSTWALIELVEKFNNLKQLKNLLKDLTFPEGVTRFHLNKALIDNYNQGKTLLWLIVYAAYYKDTDSLNNLMKILTIKPLDLNAAPTMGFYKEVTVFWLLVRLAIAGYPEALQAIISNLSDDEINEIHFNAAPVEGNSNGETALWWLAILARGGQPEILARVVKALVAKGNISKLKLNAAPVEGVNKGITVFWNLVQLAIAGHPKALQAIISNLTDDEINEIHFNAAPVEGDSQGYPALWGLVFLARSGQLEILARIVKALVAKGNISKLKLNAGPVAGPNKGVTVFWMLVHLAIEGHPEVLQAIISNLSNDEINRINFNAAYTKDFDNKNTALWKLVVLALNGYPEFLNNIINRLKDDAIRKFDLKVVVIDEKNETKPLLLDLYFAMSHGCGKSVARIIELARHEDIASINLKYFHKEFSYFKRVLRYMPDGSAIAEQELDEVVAYDLGALLSIELAKIEENKALRNLMKALIKDSANVAMLYNAFAKLAGRANTNHVVLLIALYQCMSDEASRLLTAMDSRIIFEADLCKRVDQEIDTDQLSLLNYYAQHKDYKEKFSEYESCIAFEVSLPLLRLCVTGEKEYGEPENFVRIDTPHFYSIYDIMSHLFAKGRVDIGIISSPMSRENILFKNIIIDNNAMRRLWNKVKECEQLEQLHSMLSELNCP